MRKVRTGDICIVPDCLSAYYKGCGIRFHSFPEDINMRKKWLRRLKLSMSDYHDDAVICVLHFTTANFHRNNKRGRLRDDAVPHLKKRVKKSETEESDIEDIDIEKALEELKEEPSTDEDEKMVLSFSDDEGESEMKKEIKTERKIINPRLKPKVKKEPSKLIKKEHQEIDFPDSYEDPDTITSDDTENVMINVCRICFATNCKMYSMKRYDLEETYILLMGVNASMFDASKMPDMLCFECLRRLQNYIEFSTKSLNSWSLLLELIEENKLTMDNIKSVNREQNMLTSKLATTHIEPNFFNLQIEEIDENETENNSTDEFNSNKDLEYDDSKYLVELKVEGDAFDSEVESYSERQELSIVSESDTTNETTNISEKDHDINFDSSEVNYFNDIGHSERDLDQDDSDSDRTVDSDEAMYNTKGKKKFSERYIKEYNELFSVRTLTVEEQRRELESRKDCSAFQKARFKCDMCYRFFRLEAPYKAHMKKHTDESGQFVCDICKIHFATLFSLKVHIPSSHVKQIKCRKCSFKTTLRNAACQHKNYHEGRRFQCPKCPKNFVKQNTFIAHCQRWHPQDAVCHLCGESLVGVQSLTKHLRSAHKDEDWLVPFTKKKTRIELQNVRRHENTSNSKYELVSFVTTLPSKAPYCKLCDIRFKDRSALKKHEQVSFTHGNPWKNPYSKRWNTDPGERSERKPATRAPSGPITCEQCSAQCESFRAYNTHFAAEHPGVNRTQYSDARPTFMCEVCGRVFQNVTLLNDHRRSHSGEKPHACTKCNATYSTKQALYIHTVSHERKYVCALCEKSFTTRSGLMRHVMIHTGNKPYKCTACNKRFCTPSDKRAHVQHAHRGVPWPKKKKNALGSTAKVTSSADKMDTDTEN